MIFDFTEQEHNYLLQVLAQRPVQEALPLVLKLTNQKLAPAEPPRQAELRLAPS